MADTATGTSCIFSARFCAVTMTSSNCGTAATRGAQVPAITATNESAETILLFFMSSSFPMESGQPEHRVLPKVGKNYHRIYTL